MKKTIRLSQLRFADLQHSHNVITWPQGPEKPLPLTEALKAQRENWIRLYFCSG